MLKIIVTIHKTEGCVRSNILFGNQAFSCKWKIFWISQLHIFVVQWVSWKVSKIMNFEFWVLWDIWCRLAALQASWWYTQDAMVSSYKYTQTIWCKFWISKIPHNLGFNKFLVCIKVLTGTFRSRSIWQTKLFNRFVVTFSVLSFAPFYIP